MSRSLPIHLLLLPLALLLPRLTVAQDLRASIGFGPFTAATHAPNVINRFRIPELSGSGSSKTFELSYELPLWKLPLAVAGGVEYVTGSFTSDQFVSSGRTSSVQLTSDDLRLRVATEGRLSIGPAQVTGGFWIAPKISHSFTESVHAEDGTPFANGSPDSSILNSRLPVSGTPYGVRLAVGPRNTVHLGIPLRLEAFAALDLNGYSDAGFSAISAGLGIAIPLTTERPQPTLTALPTQQTVSQSVVDTGGGPEVHATSQVKVPVMPPTLTAAFYKDGKQLRDHDTVAARILDTLVRQFAMLPHELAITDGASLSREYRKLSANEAQRFRLDSLTRVDLEGIGSAFLNILAFRLQRNPQARITFNVPAAHATLRKELTDYFVGTWRLTATQVRFTNGELQDSALTFDCEPKELLAPVATAWVVRRFELDGLSFTAAVTPSDAPNVEYELYQAKSIQMDTAFLIGPQTLAGSVERSFRGLPLQPSAPITLVVRSIDTSMSPNVARVSLMVATSIAQPETHNVIRVGIVDHEELRSLGSEVAKLLSHASESSVTVEQIGTGEVLSRLLPSVHFSQIHHTELSGRNLLDHNARITITSR